MKLPFAVKIRDADAADLSIGGGVHRLRKGVYSPWIPVAFRAAPGIKVHGVCRFLLRSTEPEFALYVTPINLDPERPAMPISYPAIYSTYLAKRQGQFATLGLAEDTWALNEGVLDDEAFIQQCIDCDRERERDVLRLPRQGQTRAVRRACSTAPTASSTPSGATPTPVGRQSRRHVQADGQSTSLIPRRSEAASPGFRAGRALPRPTPANARPRAGRAVPADGRPAGPRRWRRATATISVLMIISDHGFNSFRRGVDLNRWLEIGGYLKVKEGLRAQKYLAADRLVADAGLRRRPGGHLPQPQGPAVPGDRRPRGRGRRFVPRNRPKARRPDRSRERVRPAVKTVYLAREVYRGPYKDAAPDLIVGYQRGYRASWETAVGQVTDNVFHTNKKAWSGDHCVDQTLVPGVLFCNRKIETEHPRLMDIGPTVLDLFGVPVPAYMDGKPLAVE